jgi:hypothetical protein
MLLILLNSLVHILTTNEPEYERPWITKPENVRQNHQSAVSASAETMRDIFFNGGNKLQQKQSARNNLTKNFNMENMNKWLDFLEKEDAKAMSNSVLFSNLANIRIMAGNIQTYIQETCQRIDAIMNLIDLKVKEIGEIDKRLLSLRPNYRNTIERVADNSQNLLQALEKEKKIVKKVMKKLKSSGLKLESTSKKTEVVENDHKSYAAIKIIKNGINSKLSSFMSLKYFPAAHKNFMKIVDDKFGLLTEKDLSDLGSVASQLIKEHWKDILVKESQRKQKKIVSELKAEKKLKEVITEEANEEAEEKLKGSRRKLCLN